MKHKQIFIDKKGLVYEPSSSKVKINNRNRTYVIIRKNDELLCIYDKDYQVYTLPEANDIANLNLKPSSNFKILSYIKEKNRYYKESQTFNIYELVSGKTEGSLLRWCKINDILLHRIAFDETMFKGFKNLYVRD